MKKKRLILLVSVVLICGFIDYFYEVFAAEKPTVAVVLKESESEYWKIMASGFEKGFKNFGVNGKIYAPDGNDGNQYAILQKVLKDKPDVLIYSPNNPQASIPILKEFKKKHIPVLLVDTDVKWSGQTSFIGTDNPILGEKAGELLSSMLQPGDKAALIGWVSNDTISKDRVQGAKEALHKVGIETVGDDIPAGTYNDSAIPVIAKVLKNHPDIKGVFASNDSIALEVIEYLKGKGLNIPVVGADGIIDMLKYIQNGTSRGSVAQNPYDMGYVSVENAVKTLKGQSVEKKINSDVDIITTDNAKSKIDFIHELLKN
ncbi:sugar ABC transporter substrate-binding protein [Bacillus sp. USDA818B3_A]|uniref:sugar ABC transporter substrate-binding protein n=1 Tax=Bacillus sp. USDA818B3_A TaxID=2698834 RepID=UPI00136C1B55|nr:sugar ABC transporter substrate-binding protein [Bacillus sp. USDA818B3_A]